jgi:hypothetical protein
MSPLSPLRIVVLAVLASGLPAAAAAENEVAHLHATAALLEESVRGVLPLPIALPRALGDDARKTFFLTELRYCGASDQGNGRLRVAGRLGSGEDRKSPVLAGEEACRGGLAAVAESASPALAEGTLLADLESSWKGWVVKLSLLRAVIVGKEGRARAVSGLGKPVEMAAFSTTNLRIDNGAGSPILLHARPSFLSGAVAVAVVLADKAPAKPPRGEPGARDVGLAGSANVAAEIPARFANPLLRRLTGTEPLVIPVSGDEIEVQNVALSGTGTGENARLTLEGIATPRSVRETLRWTLLAAGEPLRFASVRASAELEDCSALGTMAALGCNARNVARTAAAEAFAQALTQRYQGQLVHELASPVDLRFAVAGQRIVLRGDLLRTSFGAHGLSATARLAGD